MKKILLLLLLTVCCQLGNAQNLFAKYKDLGKPNKDLFSFSMSEDTRDAAYEAPTTKLTNKKWYQVGTYYGSSDFDFMSIDYYVVKHIYEFNANGTGKLYRGSNNYYYTTPIIWKRAKDKLTITYYYSQTTFVYDKEATEGLSLRKQDELEEQRLKEERDAKSKKNTTETITIFQLEDDYLIFEDHPSSPPIAFVSEEELDVIIAQIENIAQAERESAAKAAEEAAKAAEQAEKVKIGNDLNSQAYSEMRQGQFDEAIASIDKAIELLPNDANYYDSKGEILYMKGDIEGAKAMWEKAISLDPEITAPERGSVLNWLITNKGWQDVTLVFPQYVPFKKIRVRITKNIPLTYNHVFFTTEPKSNNSKEDTNYGVDFCMHYIYNGGRYYDKKIKKCTDVGDGWYEYEYNQQMYFSHYQSNAPLSSLKVLIE